MSRTLLSSKREDGLSLEILQRQRASSSGQGRISWFACSCGGYFRVPIELGVDMGDPLMSHQESQISFGIVWGTGGFLTHGCMDE